MVGFIGVLLVASPGTESFNIGVVLAIVNAIMYGAVTAAVRGLSATESAETLTMHQMVSLTLAFAVVMLPIGFIWPGNRDLGALLINGAFNGVGQYLWIRSLTLAPTAAVGPFYYFSLVWAMVLGFIFWGDIPTPLLLAGSAVVVGSGLFLLWHERGKAAPPEPD